MKKHIIFALSAVLALSFTSCKDEETVEPGTWNSSADYAVVSFVERDNSIELDPTENTVVTYHMSRRNPELSEVLDAEEERVNQLLEEEEKNKNAQLEDTTLTPAQRAEIDSLYKQTVKDIMAEYNEFVDSKCKANLDSIVVPIVITNGMDSIFTISPATFKQGEWVGEYTISFPNAEVGTTYEAQYAVTDTRFVSYYSDAATGSFTVTRVKWEPAGFVYNNGQKVPGYVTYVDDFITAYFGVQNVSYFVECEERVDRPGVFRLKNPYGANYPYNDPGDWDDSKDYYMVIDASNPNKVFMNPAEFDLGLDWGYGMIFVRNYAGYYVAAGRESAATEDFGTYADGAITFPASSFAIGMVNYKGTYDRYANTNGAMKVIIDPDAYAATQKYEASLFTEGDFEWEKVLDGQFTSNQLKTTTPATLYKGVCVATTDNADSVFTAKYGVPYIISEPYAEDYDLVFFVKDGRIQMPKDFDDYFGMQELGIEAAGMPIYGTINGSSSSFSDTEVKLNITFQAERKYTNENGRTAYEYITLDTNDEFFANITWSKVGTGTYYYEVEDEDGNLGYEEDPGLEVFQRDDRQDLFYIDNWYMGGQLYYQINEDKSVSVAFSDTGWNLDGYGEIYVSDPESVGLSSYAETYPTYFDPETNTIYFGLIYHTETQALYGSNDKFVIDGSSAAAKAKAPLLKDAMHMHKFFETKSAPTFRKIGNYPTKGQKNHKSGANKAPKVLKKNTKLNKNVFEDTTPLKF